MEPLMPELEIALKARVRSRHDSRRAVRIRRVVPLLGAAASAAIVAAIFLFALGVHPGSQTGSGSTSTLPRGAAASLHLWVGAPRGVVPPTQLVPAQYWYLRTLDEEQVFAPVARGRHPKVVPAIQDTVIERWISRAGQATRSVETPIGPLHFPNARDQARWRAAGSPRPAGDSGRPTPSYTYGLTGFGSLAEFSYSDLERLPTSAHQLIARIQARLKALAAPSGPRAVPHGIQLEGETADAILTLLEAPAPARVHAGLLAAARLLAGSHTHTGEDLIGRRGIVLQLLPGGTSTLIINSTSGALLANGALAANAVSGNTLPGRLATYLAAGVVSSSTTRPPGMRPVIDSR